MEGKGEEENSLVHSTKVEIGGMLNDPTFCFVFALIYEITLPTIAESDNVAKNRFSTMVQPVMEVLVRWGTLSSGGQGNLEPGHHETTLLGGPHLNPFENLAYTANPPIFNENMLADAKVEDSGILSFVLQLSKGSDLSSFHSQQIYDQKIGQVARNVEIERSERSLMVFTGSEKKDDDDNADEDFPSRQGDSNIPVDSSKSLQAMAVTASAMPESLEVPPASELKELPYFSTQLPIFPEFPAGRSDLTGNRLSRAALAQLLTFNFPVILAADGSPAEMVDASNLISKTLLDKDYENHLKVNEIIFQFMAFNRYSLHYYQLYIMVHKIS